MPDAPLTRAEIEEALKDRKFTAEDEHILRYALDHNLGYRLADAVQHLLDDHSRALRELLAAREDRSILAWLYAHATHQTGTAGTGTPVMIPTREAVLEAIEEEKMTGPPIASSHG